MTREKKKFTYDQLEERVINWCIDQLEQLREISDRIYRDTGIDPEEKEIIYGGLARQVSNLLELILPLRHDEENLLLWAHDFVDEYETYDKDYHYN